MPKTYNNKISDVMTLFTEQCYLIVIVGVILSQKPNYDISIELKNFKP